MCNKNNSAKVLIGLAIGAAIGAAITYFSDSKKRNDFIDDVSDQTSRVRENIKDAYYEGRIRARKAKRDLSRYMSDLKEDASELYDDALSRAKKLAGRGKEAAEKVIELTEDELNDLKEQAKQEAEMLAKDK